MATQPIHDPERPFAGQVARYRAGRRSRLAIWWQEVDRGLLAIVFVLMAIGAMAVAAGSPATARRLSTSAQKLPELYFFWAHLRWLAVGLVALFLTARMTRETARRTGIVLSLVMLAAMVIVPFVGAEINGARRWINIGMRFQPSQFLGAGFPILLAWILSWKVRDPKLPVIAFAFALMAVIAALLMVQPDFGTTLLFGGTFFVLIVLSGMPLKRIGQFAALGMGALVVMYLTYDNGRNRIDSFFDGGHEFDQVNLAQRTLLNGGWLGNGFWMGQRKFSLPEAHTDYIFSVIGEEFGLLACLVIVFVYLALVVRVLLRLVDEEDLFTVLAAAGLGAQLGGQAFINMLVNLQLFPSKGMTLPLVSYGGSSTIAVCMAFGLLLAITRRNPYIDRERFSLSDIGSLQ